MFSEKKLKITITRYEGTMWNINFNSKSKYVFENFRVDCNIKKVPASCGYTASVDIYGVSQQEMNSITNICWINGQLIPMSVRIEANDGNGYVTLFEGGIMEAVPNYKNVPDVSIHIESSMMVYPNLKKVPPISLTTNTIISSFCSELCGQYNYLAESDEYVSDLIWKGDTKILDQKTFGLRIKELCRIVGLEYSLRNGVVKFYRKGTGSRKVWKFTPNNYIGYPTFENFGISIQTDSVTKDINCMDGLQISDSIIPQVNTTWIINSIEYKLETRKENGAWNMTIRGTRIKQNG